MNADGWWQAPRGARGANVAFWYALAASHLWRAGIYDLLVSRPMGANDIKAELSAVASPNERRLLATLELLVAARLLTKDKHDRYSVAPEAKNEGPELGLNESLVARLLDPQYLWKTSSSAAYFDNLDRDQRLGFASTMESQLHAPAQALCKHLALSHFDLVVDVGSGTGLLARRLVAAGIARSAICLDIDDFARRAGAAATGDERLEPFVSFCKHDLQRDLFPRGDLFLLSRVLHDWSDFVCADLLRRIASAMSDRALLVVHEELGGGAKVWPKALDFFLASSLGDGRVRTELELRGLLEASGLVVRRVKEVDECTALLFAELTGSI